MDRRLIHQCHEAARLLERSDGLLVCAGAGLGAESLTGTGAPWGTPLTAPTADGFRWHADMFLDRPAEAWGLWGALLQQARELQPHAGFARLQQICDTLPRGGFLHTTAVDGQLRRAGFDPDRIVEARGSLHHLQCSTPCCDNVWSAAGLELRVEHGLWTGEVPLCEHCYGTAARPNLQMLVDHRWVGRRSNIQRRRMADWLVRCRAPITLEIGAGASLVSERRFSQQQRGPLIRIHPQRAEVLKPGVALQATAGEALEALATVLAERGLLRTTPPRQRAG